MRTFFFLKIYIVFFFLLLSTSVLTAQVSEGGIPPSFTSLSVLKRSIQPYVATLDVDIKQLKNEDSVNENAGIPIRLAHTINVDINTDNSGEWSVLESGQLIWRLQIKSEGAIALIFKYSEFYIPSGGRLFLYNEDHTHILGAYTKNTNPRGREFATEAIAGDVVTLEYVQDIDTKQEDKPRIHISGIGYCYNHVSVVYNIQTRINESSSCQVNINCSEGDDWQHNKKGIARTITPIGNSWYYCSGSLVNNTSDKVMPYYLSAHHCFYDDAKNQAVFSQMIFYFHYEASGCSNPTDVPTTTKTLVGAELLVDIDIEGGSDGALLLINEDIPETYDVYYNGWDVSGSTPLSGVGIHHPRGDVKKISTYKSPATSVTWWDGEYRGDEAAHWRIIFAATANGHGVTEGGSSGSPLFNENHLIVGTLTGGNSSCSYRTGTNLYGKLSQHWDKYAQKMKPYLDPDNTGKTSIEGRYLVDTASLDFTSDETSIIEGGFVVFKDRSYGAKTINWIFEGGIPETSTERNPEVRYDVPGLYDVKIIMDKGLISEKALSKSGYIEVKEWKGIVIPNSLKATLDSRKDRINISWERRGLSPTEDIANLEQTNILQRDNGYSAKVLDFVGNNYKVFSKWTVEDMSLYKSIVLTSIRILPSEMVTSYVLKVKQDGNDIFSKEVKASLSDGYFKYNLDVPIQIDLSKDLYIGYEVDAPDGISIPYGDTPIIKGRNMLNFDNKNYYAEYFGVDGNWNIQADAKIILKPEFWYTIYRDGEIIASDITTSSFVDYDLDLSRKSYCYTINTSFLDGRSTEKENEECVGLPTLENPALLIYDKTTQTLRILSNNHIESVAVYNLYGNEVAKYWGKNSLVEPVSLSTSQWSNGLYIIKLRIDKKNITYKILL